MGESLDAIEASKNAVEISSADTAEGADIQAWAELSAKAQAGALPKAARSSA